MVLPLSKKKLIWDFLTLIILVFNSFYIPLNISFFSEDQEDINIIIFIVMEILPRTMIAIDSLVTLNTAYFHKGYETLF